MYRISEYKFVMMKLQFKFFSVKQELNVFRKVIIVLVTVK